MAGSLIEIDLDSSILQQELARMEGRLDDMTVAMNDIGAHLAGVTQDRFFAGEDPDGHPWAPLNPLYAETKAESSPRYDGTLMFMGTLRESIVHVAGRDMVEVGTNEVYAAIHQFGGVIRPKTTGGLFFTMGFEEDGKPKNWLLSSVTIPARPYLGLSMNDEKEVVAILRDYVVAV